MALAIASCFMVATASELTMTQRREVTSVGQRRRGPWGGRRGFEQEEEEEDKGSKTETRVPRVPSFFPPFFSLSLLRVPFPRPLLLLRVATHRKLTK